MGAFKKMREQEPILFKEIDKRERVSSLPSKKRKQDTHSTRTPSHSISTPPPFNRSQIFQNAPPPPSAKHKEEKQQKQEEESKSYKAIAA
ncbi:hypothetical protein ACLOJK_021711 [Asimina triloba]